MIIWPYVVGLLERRGKQRLAALDAVSCRRSDTMSRVLTENLRYVSDALGQVIPAGRVA